ncbi:MAG TPA: DUF4340 domain-containing protein [Clostridia bacterium]|nr:DUF4340 domain-containing protein [Clostridia bacterium]
MKIFKTTIVLLVVFAVLFGYYFYESKTNRPVKEDNKIFTFKNNDVNSLKIEKEGKTLIDFKKEGDTWFIKEPIDYKADSIYVDELLDSLASLTFDRTLEGDLSTYGLDKPSYAIKVSLKNGKSYSLFIGNKSPVKENYQEGYYIETDGGKIYRVNASSLENFFLTNDYVYKYMEKFVVSIPKNEITKLVFYQAGKEYQIQKDEKDNWQIDGKAIKADDVDNLLDGIVLLQISGLDEGKNISQGETPFAFDVYGKSKVEKISFAKRDTENKYVLINGHCIGQYVTLKDIKNLQDTFDKLIK